MSRPGRQISVIASLGCLIGLVLFLPANAKPPLTVLEHPSTEDLEQDFQRWTEKYPGRFRSERRGVTPGGRPILMGRITDYRVPDEDKQIALLTSCHVARSSTQARACCD